MTRLGLGLNVQQSGIENFFYLGFPAYIEYQVKSPGKVNATGVILSILPTECQLVHKIWDIV